MSNLDNQAATSIKYHPYYYAMYSLNPNSSYSHKEAEALARCREDIKKAIGAKDGQVIFVSNASEAARILYQRVTTIGDVLDYSLKEHDCVWQYMDDDWVDIGGITAGSVWCMAVNNITGEVFPLNEIREEIGNKVFLISDCNAAIGKIDIAENVTPYVDALFFSGLKIHGPHGIGCMWLSDRLWNTIYHTNSPTDEFSLRYGTQDVPSIMALRDAVAWACNKTRLKERRDLWFVLFKQMCGLLSKNKIDYRFVSCPNYTDAIIAIQFSGINADALQQFCASKGVLIGRGASACDSSDDSFRILKQYGLSKQDAQEVVRLSFDETTGEEDVKNFIECVMEFKEKFWV